MYGVIRIHKSVYSDKGKCFYTSYYVCTALRGQGNNSTKYSTFLCTSRDLEAKGLAKITARTVPSRYPSYADHSWPKWEGPSHCPGRSDSAARREFKQRCLGSAYASQNLIFVQKPGMICIGACEVVGMIQMRPRGKIYTSIGYRDWTLKGTSTGQGQRKSPI